MTKFTLFLFLFLLNLLFCYGDTETYLGPKYSPLTFCHWNLNRLTAHDSIITFLIQAYITQHNYDIKCLSKTFLHSSFQSDDDRILIHRYNLIRSDHPNDSKRVGLCIYFEEHIPLNKCDDLCVLDKCLVTEIYSQSKTKQINS